MYEAALEAARESGADIVQCGFFRERKDGAAPSAKRPEAFSGFDGCKDGVEIHVWCKLFRAAFLAENSLRFVSGIRVAEDIWFSDLAYGFCKKGVSINRPLYHYDTMRQTSVVHKAVGERALESDEAIQALIKVMGRIERLIKEQDVAVIAGGG